ncbi:myrosinase 1-like [Schistocerca serialis cubense]|uniref:myrosinase 1-like n=1 Tax=Schistocerca serialis cubense TaxID=2023355 RepID=UPI00214E3878|nr:myrosinase 1-like [Schistocerca serialis cubense]
MHRQIAVVKMRPTVCLLFLLAAGVLGRPGRPGARGPPNNFPKDFIFAAATASYQVEGAWNEGGKGESIFDRMFHTIPNITTDGSNGDVACDSYHKYEIDIQLAKDMNVDAYRFSVSWPRVLPTGDVNNINQEGIDYYNKVIDGLIAKGITPVVTMFHWDLPQTLQDIGGWPNPRLADYFVEYARVLYDNYGDRVKWWQTFNEPGSVVLGYSGGFLIAPGINSSGVGDYMAAYTLLKAHAGAYRLYDEKYRQTQKGKVGITISNMWYEPATDSAADIEAAERKMQFYSGLYSHPIFTAKGDWPEVVKQRIAANSKAAGYPRSRLVELTLEEVEYIRGTSDFYGLNHYTANPVSDGSSGYDPSMEFDAGVVIGEYTDAPQGASTWHRSTPWAFRKLFNWLAQQYPGYPIFVMENGWSDTGELEDQGRIDYYTSYLAEMLKAINEDGVDVIGYTAWSLLDNFEWGTGFTTRFGLHYVDFNDPDRKRTPKASSKVLGQIFKTKTLPAKYLK